MIGIDTNHLLRVFVEKDHIQSYQVKKLIEQQGTVYVSSAVFLEVIWTLETRYGFTKKDLMQCIESILKAQHFDVQLRDAMWLAFSDFQHFNIGFSDCVIGALGRVDGCDYTATFDKKAAKSKSFKLTKL